MWGRKKKQPEPKVKPNITVETVPVEFYAGANPVIKFKNVEKEILTGTITKTASSAAKTSVSSASPGAGSRLVQKVVSSRKNSILLVAGLFVFFIAVASAYYWVVARRAVQTGNSNQTVPISRPPAIETPPPIALTSTLESVPTPVAVSTTPEKGVVSTEDVPLEFPSMLLADATDTDKDGLSDPEEELYTTDPELPDTDRDGHPDSVEVYNLYNPTGKEPMKIINSGLVKEFVNPVFGYKIYYPNSWIADSVDTNYRDVLISTLSGENIEIRAIEKKSEQTFADWFGVWAPGERYSDIVPFSSVFKEVGHRRSDYLVYYFEDASRVYVVAYHTTNSDIAHYRTVIKMIARSFRLGDNANSVPVPSFQESSTTLQQTPDSTATTTDL